MGVVEHTFFLQWFTMNHDVQWKFYDVGGGTNQRATWIPYFEDINAIIFIAPISAFDQVLAEDPRVNRLEDSFLLWQAVVSNRLFARVGMILLLNKCDLLQAKLDAGVRFNQHVLSYGDRPNDYESVSRYLSNKFRASVRRGDEGRTLFTHLVALTDTRRKIPPTIIENVREIVFRSYLKDHIVTTKLV
ncbi:guanine nucleotide binding protein, alpha subunit [Mycena maculata]|uniref:Guanine nucleotide binding protein, alpha subunit n=1 Tax=Mycena maculata TaxID=230809 RepID=A0AAD7IX38_9AGAR|nr:guanine nucleotide binding protein, alpha subunit [Mycena maculata]